MKVLQRNLKLTLIMLWSGAFLTVAVHRGLHGDYEMGIHGFNVSCLLLLPSYIVVVKNGRNGASTKTILTNWKMHLIVVLFSLCLVVYYLSSNGLWCVQHPSITKALCEKLIEFASFAESNNVTTWWLSRGDLLALQKGLDKPFSWEHDIDICITYEQFPILLNALSSNPGFFKPDPEFLKGEHLYLPIDVEKLGLLSTTKRTAEGANIDVLACPTLVGNVTRVAYCNGFMNVPKSKLEKSALLHKFYGDYSKLKYKHHAWMCNIWTG